jgi:TRAP transporter TAXI family solute receptor
MSTPDDLRDPKESRRRKRRKSLLLLLLTGVLVFAAAAGGLYYALRPVTLRIAVGPPESDDQKLIQAMAETFDRERKGVRLSPIVTGTATQSVALLGASKADLAVARGDLQMPGDAEAVVIVRKNVVVLWSSPPARRSTKQAAPKIKAIDELEGHRVGVIGKTPANVALLRMILTESGVVADKVAVTQFGTDQIEELARDPNLDAFMTVGPLDSKITAEALAATTRARGQPKFLPIDVSEAIALKHPLYESEEIPGSVFNVNPAWPDDKIETISVSHLIVARKSVSETTVAALAKQVLADRQVLAREVPGAAHIKKPDTDKDAALTVHRGAAAYIDGTERTFLDQYGDYFWFSLLLLSGVGSAGAWLRQYLKRDEREEVTELRARIMGMISRVRAAQASEELLVMQREVDAIIRDTLDCHDDGAIDEEDLAAFGLVLELFDHAVADRRAALEGSTPEPTRLRALPTNAAPS